MSEEYDDDIETIGLSGEYWFDEHGTSMYADGNTGDMNHEMYVLDACSREVLNTFGIDSNDEYVRIDDHMDEIENVVAQYKGIELHELYEMNIDDEIIQYLQDNGLKNAKEYWGVIRGKIDAREFAIKNWNWKRVHGDSIESNKLTRDDLKIIASAINNALYDEGKSDEESEEALENHVYTISTYTGNRYEISLKDMEDGNVEGLERSDIEIRNSAAAEQLKKMDAEIMPQYYKGAIGDSVEVSSDNIINEVYYRDAFGEGFKDFYKKYSSKANKNLWIRFTNKGSYDPLDKNPYTGKTNHNDPSGIYAYPIRYVIDYPADIWYGSHFSYLQVLSPNMGNYRNILELSKITNEIEFSNAYSRIRYKNGLPHEDINTIIKKFKSKSSFNYIFKNPRHKWKRLLFALVQYDINNDLQLRSATEQSNILKKAGYTIIIDNAKNENSATINPAEPQQIIFLTRHSFDIIDTFKINPVKKDNNNPAYDYSSFLTKLTVDILKYGFDDKIKTKETGSTVVVSYSVKGRKINLQLERPISWYANRTHGKKHKQDDKYSSFSVLKCQIYTERGNINISFNVDKYKETLRIIIDEVKKLSNNDIVPNWHPLSVEYERKKHEDDMKKMAKEQVNKEYEKFLTVVPDIQTIIQKIVKNAGYDENLVSVDDLKVNGVRRYLRYISREYISIIDRISNSVVKNNTSFILNVFGDMDKITKLYKINENKTFKILIKSIKKHIIMAYKDKYVSDIRDSKHNQFIEPLLYKILRLSLNQ